MSDKSQAAEVGRLADDGCPHVDDHRVLLSDAEALVLVGMLSGRALRSWCDGWRLPLAYQSEGRGDQQVPDQLYNRLLTRGLIAQSGTDFLRAELTTAGLDAAIDHYRAVVGGRG